MEAEIQDDTSNEEAKEMTNDSLQKMCSIFYGPISYFDPKP
jgi:hypothetical protein